MPHAKSNVQRPKAQAAEPGRQSRLRQCFDRAPQTDRIALVQTASTTIPLAAGLANASAGLRTTSWVSRVVMFGATSIVVGILWDISWHRTIGRDTFWTPAHLAIQLGGLLGGFTAGWLVFHTTFFGTNEDKAGAVRLWGFRAPLGAWVTIWGCFAMLTSAPFDNWWHDAYGLDVKIISPPHAVLALGMWSVVGGALLLVLREQNNFAANPVIRDDLLSLSPPRGEGRGEGRSGKDASQQAEVAKPHHPSPSVPLSVEGSGIPASSLQTQAQAARAGEASQSIPGRWFFIYGSGVLLAMASVFLIERSFPNQQHSAPFFIMSAATFPLYLVGIARAAKFRWGATLIALVYMLITAGMAWVLPLFEGQPKLGPIYNRVDHFVPLPFPLLLVVPAFGVDLIRNWIGAGRGWLRDIAIVLLSALVFLALFSVTQWYFAKFLLSPSAQNWFFAADRHWGYTETLGPWRTQFWDAVTPATNPPAVARTFAIALGCALVSSAIGLTVGNWMAKVRR